MSIESKSKSKAVFLTPEGDLKNLKNIRVVLLTALFVILNVIGIINLYSASLGDAVFYAQLHRMVFGTVLFALFGWFIPTRYINNYAYFVFALILMMLLVVVILGHSAGGSTRWIHLGAVAIQPSEFAKLAMAVCVARFFYLNRQVLPYRLKDLWLILLLTGLVFTLIFVQPDLGTAGVCLLIAAAQVCFVRLHMLSIGIVFISGILTSAVGWVFFLRDYQKLRILNLFNPNLDPHGSGYNSIQSLVAVGSGRLFGKGFMQGTQTQLQFLPAHHTDFIFSVFSEEMGFIPGAIVFILFGLLTYLALEIAKHVNDAFSSILAVGIGALIYIEFSINVAMVLGLFPVVGMPLPFFSYGGSSLITLCIAMGILVGIERKKIASLKV